MNLTDLMPRKSRWTPVMGVLAVIFVLLFATAPVWVKWLDVK